MSVTVPKATATASAYAPNVSTAGNVAISVPTAGATASAPAPSIHSDAIVQAVTATATASMPPPLAGAGVSVNVIVPKATATASAYAPTATAGISVTVSVTTAQAVAQGKPPAVQAVRNVEIDVETATATAFAPIPKVLVNVNIIVPTYEVSGIFNVDEYISTVFNVDEYADTIFNTILEMVVTWGMSADQRDYEIWRGETRNLNVTVRKPDSSKMSISGATADWYLLRSEDDSDDSALIHKTYESGALTDPANGVFTVSLAPIDTKSMKVGQYAHRGAVTDANGNRCVLFTGTISLK